MLFGQAYNTSRLSLPTTQQQPSGQLLNQVFSKFISQSRFFSHLTVDHSPPEFVPCPADIVRRIPDTDTDTEVTWSDPDVTDDSGVVIGPSLSEGPPSGSFLRPGVHTVTYVARDLAGNIATCTFTITITRGKITSPLFRSGIVRKHAVRWLGLAAYDHSIVGSNPVVAAWCDPRQVTLLPLASRQPRV